MHLVMYRSYHTNGTNGSIFIEGKTEPLCYSIELPWRDNKRNISCIPEGVYKLHVRVSKKHHLHLQVCGVPARCYILIHKGNNAAQDLKGCIAVVSKLTGPGTGIDSDAALQLLTNYALRDEVLGIPLTLTILAGSCLQETKK
ncbi:MAG: hypothetical protein EAZ13_04320 [Sphingobacteriia bacterium]|nr:MAG: hypothetical protein EAZ13_04320 [Sphingobacteriia bacterium]